MNKSTILELIESNSSDFTVYKIPKKSGGLRTIFALHSNRKEKYEDLKRELEFIEPHKNAVAYRKGYKIVDAVNKHKNFKWHYKFDFSDFFPSCTFEKIYPFFKDKMNGKMIAKMFWYYNRRVATQQGHPTSPMVTNIVMKPFDEYLTNTLNKRFKGKVAYTRYADDILISTNIRLDVKKLEKDLKRILKATKLDFLKLNSEKTAEMNRNGKVYFLGVCISNKGTLSLGHAARKEIINGMNALKHKIKAQQPIELDKMRDLLNKAVYYNAISENKIDVKAFLKSFILWEDIAKTRSLTGYAILTRLNSIRHLKKMKTDAHDFKWTKED